MKFSFVVLTWNRSQFLERCLKALTNSIEHQEHCEIVVMDNGSTDGTKAVLMSYADRKNVRIMTRRKLRH
jgi:glycosyltransferase involved in cell wall biosynthesis